MTLAHNSTVVPCGARIGSKPFMTATQHKRLPKCQGMLRDGRCDVCDRVADVYEASCCGLLVVFDLPHGVTWNPPACRSCSKPMKVRLLVEGPRRSFNDRTDP